LCNITLAEPHFTYHCNDKHHIAWIQDIRQMQSNPTTCTIVELQLRVDQLGLKAWQTEVLAQLYWCLLYQFSHDNSALTRMKAAETLLVKYEHLERVSLLELAAWKAVCIAAKVNGCHHSWQEWYRGGWKGSKPGARTAREIGILVVSVVPFLH
jgi:hypothetical protein